MQNKICCITQNLMTIQRSATVFLIWNIVSYEILTVLHPNKIKYSFVWVF